MVTLCPQQEKRPRTKNRPSPTNALTFLLSMGRVSSFQFLNLIEFLPPLAFRSSCISPSPRSSGGGSIDGSTILKNDHNRAHRHALALEGSFGLTRSLLSPSPDMAPPLVRVDKAHAGFNCVAGGVKVHTGKDVNGYGSIEINEVETTQFIRNGKAGLQGNPGAAGASGQKSPVAAPAETEGDNCLSSTSIAVLHSMTNT